MDRAELCRYFSTHEVKFLSTGLELHGWSQYSERFGVCYVVLCFAHGEEERMKLWWQTTISNSSLARSVCSALRIINLALQVQRNRRELTSVLEESVRKTDQFLFTMVTEFKQGVLPIHVT